MAGGIRRNAGSGLEENSEINVVPFIDIMLVLLIIFMVAAPLATVDVNVDLPASTAQQQERPEQPLYVTLREDLSLHLGENPVPREGLGAAMDAITEGDKEARVFLRADRSVDYEHLMELMNILRDAGYLRIALVGLERTAMPAAEPAADPTEADPAGQAAPAGGAGP